MKSTGSYLWRPEEHAWTRTSHVARFMERRGFADFESLRARAAADTEWFWQAALDDIGLYWHRPFERIRDASGGLPWTKWFIGGRINITENCIDRHVACGHGDETALYYEPDSDDSAERRRVTFVELSAEVDACAAAMRAAGVGKGDSVALYAPMRVETVVVMFATFKIGAIFVPVFCGFGEQALVDRMEFSGVKLLFAAKALHRRGKAIDSGAIATSAAKRVKSVERVVFTDTEDWDEFLKSSEVERVALNALEGDRHSEGRVRPFDKLRPGGTAPHLGAETDAEQPCLVIYTSGTTGKPKGTVHTHGGVLAQVGKELRYAFDVHAGEPFFWVTDIGWMMGPWKVIGCLMYRVPVVLFDGAPDYPTGDRIWEIVQRLRVVTLGIAPTAVRLLMRLTDARGPHAFDHSALRVLGSTGEPWDDASYRWYFEHVGRGRCPVINISGGTEIMGCHLQPYPVQPIKACDLGTGALGMDVDVFDESGKPVRGDVGYLVCKQPAPSMTKSFLGDDARYLETYFAQFPGVWSHGDWAVIDSDGHFTLHGRADDTIKVAGKRVGPAEVESALIHHPAVSEAATIGVPDELKGQVIVSFVVFKPGRTATEKDLRAQVAQELGKPLAPKAVHSVSALPKTRSGKIVRGSIRRAYLGEPAGDTSSVENPALLEAIRGLAGKPGLKR
jgi:acetyl-CoA synthetase